MASYVRGALVEYASDFLGPIPNIVVFQFNPEQIARTLNIPGRTDSTPEKNAQVETRQAGASPTESFTVTAHFSAADDLGKHDAASSVPRIFGIGPQLAALEKMVYTEGGIISGAIGAAVDAIGDALGSGNGSQPEKPIPREHLPPILFIWGPSRVLPVDIKSMSITEQKYDPKLNPVQAEVQIGLQVTSFPKNSKDNIGKGALSYTQSVKEAQAALNLANAADFAIDVIPF
ncbi:MAG: hypothetical protein SV201_08495 [Pseudomonadota bacterium]|nr:hypothetical protein [Pseudomonadota bacterium]